MSEEKRRLIQSKYTLVFLVLFLILGTYLRVYHLDFPTIGYHNMKENEYVDEARFFLTQGNWLHKQAYIYSGLDEGTGYHEEYAEVPYVAYLTAFGWSIFGESLWLPRLFMIAFMLGSILLTYFIVKRLTNNEYLSLLSSFLISVMPLGVYFGRNIQPESPGLFFILLTAFFFIKWLDTKDKKQLMYSGFAFSIAWGLKYAFGIIAVPLFFILPFKELSEQFKKHRSEFYQNVKYLFYGLIPGIFTTLLYELTIVDRSKVVYDIQIFRIFDTSYWIARWPALLSYFNDNYTWWLLWFAILGFAFVVLNYRTRFSRFLIGYAVSIIVYADLMAAKIGGHSYYQMPFLPLISILAAYFLFSVGSILRQTFKHRFVVYAPLLLLIFAAPAVQAANDRVWDTVFYGQDVLGEYLKTRMAPEERFVVFTFSQDFATCSYAQHRCGSVGSLEDFKHKDSVFHFNYIYVGQSEFDKLYSKDPLWTYILGNYHIDLVGLQSIQGKLVPDHLILKKGGKVNLTEVQGKPAQLLKEYDSKHGPVPYYIIQNM